MDMTVIERAEKLVPALAERGPATDEARRLPDATIADLATARLDATLVPTAFGGDEGDLATVCDVARVLAHGCVSTAWVQAFFAVHNWMLGLLDAKAATEIFASGPSQPCAAPFAPTGAAKRDPESGAWRLSGRWQWATGIHHARWLLCGGLAEDPAAGTTDARLFLVPVADVEVIDTWFSGGMRGTGSADVVVTDVEVPEHRTIGFFDLVNATTNTRADAAAHMALMPVLALSASAPALGGAEAALAYCRDRAVTRRLAYTGQSPADSDATRIRLARAGVRLDALALLHADAVTTVTAAAERGERLDRTTRAKVRLAAAHVVHESAAIVDELCTVSGASALMLSSPLQRIQRDVQTICGHVVFDIDVASDLAETLSLGRELTGLALV